MVLASMLLGSGLVVTRWWRTGAVALAGMVALAVKRGADARRYARDKPDDPVPVMAVLMTPVDCWIRVRALVSIATYRRRWKW
jgi:hypothetical protein